MDDAPFGWTQTNRGLLVPLAVVVCFALVALAAILI